MNHTALIARFKTARAALKIIIIWVVLITSGAEFLLHVIGYFMKHQTLGQSLAWKTGHLRILALGDSNTYGMYLDKTDAYPAQLEHNWNLHHPDKPVEIINLGYPGTDSSTLKENFPKLMQAFKPDVVLILIGFNDRWNPDVVQDASASVFAQCVSWLKRHSRIYHLYYIYSRQDFEQERLLYSNVGNGTALTEADIRHILNTTGLSLEQAKSIINKRNPDDPTFKQLEKLVAEAEASHNKTHDQSPAMADPDIANRSIFYKDMVFTLARKRQYGVPESLDKLEGNIKDMQAQAAVYGAPVYVLTYGSSWGWYREVNSLLFAAGKAGTFRLVDTTSTLFGMCSGKPPCTDYFFHDYHPNARGYGVIASDIETALSPDLVPVKVN